MGTLSPFQPLCRSTSKLKEQKSDSSVPVTFKQNIIFPIPKFETQETMSGKEKSCNLALDFPSMASAPVTSQSKSLSKANGDGALTSSLSVSSVTTNTNSSTSTTLPATSQVAS